MATVTKAVPAVDPANPPAWAVALRDVMVGFDYPFSAVEKACLWFLRHGTIVDCPGIKRQDMPTINNVTRRFNPPAPKAAPKPSEGRRLPPSDWTDADQMLHGAL